MDRLDTLDGANKDGHFSRPSSDRDLAAPGRRSCLPGPSPSDAIIFVFYRVPFDVVGFVFEGLPFNVVGFVF